MRRGLLILAFVTLGLGTANAQPGTVATPRPGQPLSPYLNLLRGGNSAVNYFNAVRPGTQAGGFAGMMPATAGGPRLSYFPGVDTLTDLNPDARNGTTVSPTGHAAGFNNTMGYFGPTSGQFFARQGQSQGPRR